MPNQNIDTVRLAQSLQPIYQQFSHQYTKGVRIPETLPAPMRQAFYKSLEDYDRTMSTELSRLVVQSFVNADDVRDGLRPISAGMRQQTRRLSNTYYQMERRVQVYETLAYQADYPILLYLSERGENTCEPCQRNPFAHIRAVCKALDDSTGASQLQMPPRGYGHGYGKPL